MDVAQICVTAATTLIAVALGGWLTIRAQDRLWRRDHQRQWRDIRLNAYSEFLTAVREYIAFILLPTAHITAVPRPGAPDDLMPFFDEKGSPYKERLEATKTSLLLVTARPDVVQASTAMVQRARWLAAERATHEVDTIPTERFADLWAAERAFVKAARTELGLSEVHPRTSLFRGMDETDGHDSPFPLPGVGQVTSTTELHRGV